MLGAPLNEVWGDDFKVEKKKKKKLKKTQPLTPSEMESELLIKPSERSLFETNERERFKLMKDDRFIEDSKPLV